MESTEGASQDHNEDLCGPVYASETTGICFLLESEDTPLAIPPRRFQEEASMKQERQTTSLPGRRLIEQPPTEKKPKWSSILGTVLRGILIWMPRLWKVVEIVSGWFTPPPS
ncbi:hypothetical protein N6L27_21530 [Leisingera sp. SS27]|uniref:hypothetical protein n=1 Tax=Leisingera sp. SS27 TaxID=2979462 RepID=UPI00232E4AC8|nr:hypothetical protein [Leisingera sp. SS27]MDC0660594.1 hypothetical protein [Leisingera sp. SS27]